MKLKTVQLWPEGSPRAFLVDSCWLKKLGRVRWKFLVKSNRARGFFGKTKTRQYLHRYILTLLRKHYPEVTFANDNWWDCRADNLKPYRRDEDGSRRKRFKNSTSKHKGVSFHKRRKKFVAMIRVKSKLHHLGYFTTADAAAAAYATAWNKAHPHLPQMRTRDRF